MRGKAGRGRPCRDLVGITPAHAGKRRFAPLTRVLLWDHPRPCGEKTRSLPYYIRIRGSPPPMRGKAVVRVQRRAENGITPAHAGKRFVRRMGAGRVEDHPRPCGEKPLFFKKRSHDLGSPPPMRGKVARVSCQGSRRRITPAHAGKRYADIVQRAEDRDHPRPCGEKCYVGRSAAKT